MSATPGIQIRENHAFESVSLPAGSFPASTRGGSEDNGLSEPAFTGAARGLPADNGSAATPAIRAALSPRIAASALRFAGAVLAAETIVEHRKLLPVALAQWIEREDFDDSKIEHGFTGADGLFLTRAEALAGGTRISAAISGREKPAQLTPQKTIP